ncbi:HAD family hydrolase [Bacillus sp. SCS-151]|uniref:HAD family hydrolase n=1 Tax=Nanhaiella sioensis TaxID=3115293 RepID=UPI00397C07E9
MIKLIVSDLDGTLLNFNKQVTDEDIDALKRANEQNITFAIATGRMEPEVLEVLKVVNDRFHRISQNGAFVITNDNEVLHHTTFSPAIAHDIYKYTRDQNDIITLVCHDNTNYAEKIDEHIERIQGRMFFPIVEKPNLLAEMKAGMAPTKIIIGGYDVQKHEKNLLELFPTQLDAFVSEENCLDVMPKNISKGNAIQNLLNHLNLSTDEIACIGDSFNDIPMFKLTANSYAMSEAHPNVKKEAKYVVNSVSEAIDHVINQNQLQENVVL